MSHLNHTGNVTGIVSSAVVYIILVLANTNKHLPPTSLFPSELCCFLPKLVTLQAVLRDPISAEGDPISAQGELTSAEGALTNGFRGNTRAVHR